MMWHPQTGPTGSVATTARATLVRRPSGVSFVIRTEQLRPHHVGPSDLIATIEAEDVFDVCERLGEVQAPTLMIGGGRVVGVRGGALPA